MKQPPYSLESERGVLGSILLDKEGMGKVSDILSAPDFYDTTNSLIYGAMKELYEYNRPIDILTVREYLDDRQNLEKIGGNKYLIELTESIFTSTNIHQYAKIVKKKSTLRKIIRTGNDILQAGYDEEADIDTVLDRVQGYHAKLDSSNEDSDVEKIDSLLYSFQDEVEYAIEFGDKKVGYKTGITSVDKYTGGLVKGRTMRLSAYANTGKSALSYAVVNSVLKQGARVLYFSLEIPKNDLRDRLLSNYYNISINRFEKKSELGGFDISEYALRDLHISSDTFTMSEIEKITRLIKPDVIFIDYIQLVKGEGNTEYEQMNDIARRIRKLTSDYNLAVFDMSQIANEQKKFTKGSVIPAKGSGELIAAANQVLLLRESEFEGKLELIIAKNRHGKKNISILLTPNFETCYFADEGAIDWGNGKKGF